MNERDAERAESELRRALASLDGIAVPTLPALGARRRSLPWWRPLFAPLATAAVLVAALAIGSGLAAWRSDRAATSESSATPSATVSTRSATPAPSASVTVIVPTDCPPETTPELKIDRYPQGSDRGAATPSAAFAAAYPTAQAPAFYKFGTNPAPVWIVAEGRTYVATILPDGSWFVSSAAFVGCHPVPVQRNLDVDGYRFAITVNWDLRYGPNPSTAAYVSAIAGFGVRCDWTRTGADIAKASEVWGTTDDVATLGSGPRTRGARGVALHGIPAAAVHGQSATMVCGMTDDTGGHGVVIDLAIGPDGSYVVRSLNLTRWSGILGDPAAVTPCTGKAGTATLIGAFTSTAAEVASWIENAAYPDAPQDRNSAFRTSYAPAAPIYVCYYSGAWAPSVPPPGPGQSERPITWDRARYFVDANGKVVMPTTIGASGPNANLEPRRPGGRF
jgi:hypothetical protein